MSDIDTLLETIEERNAEIRRLHDEIFALRREGLHLATALEQAEKERDEARAEVGKLRAALAVAETKAAKHVMTVDPRWSRRESEEAWKRAAQTLAEDLRAMTRERDEARAERDALIGAGCSVEQNALALLDLYAERERHAKTERDEARAEVERVTHNIVQTERHCQLLEQENARLRLALRSCADIGEARVAKVVRDALTQDFEKPGDSAVTAGDLIGLRRT